MLKPGGAETFKQYADQVFLPYILGQLQHASQLDLVWDSYKADSLKATARAKHGKGVRWHVTGSAPIPGNWQDFLCVDLNKKELFCYHSKALVESFRLDKQLVVTNEHQILCVPQQEDIHLIAPYSHEKADSRMMLHAVQHGHHQILFHSVDTDVVVLAVMVSATLLMKFG